MIPPEGCDSVNNADVPFLIHLMQTTLSRLQLHSTFLAMEAYGGGFVKALALAWFKADIANKSRIEAAFPHLLEAYGPGSSYYTEAA